MKDEARLRERAVRDFYDPLVNQDDPARRVGWESRVAQSLRLESLVQLVTPLERWDSVLDVGCGEGALVPILEKHGFQGLFIGEDLREAPLKRAQANYPELSFAQVDVLESTVPADIVFCSGMLNTSLGKKNHQEVVHEAIAHFFRRAKSGLVFDVAMKDRYQESQGILGVDFVELYAFLRTLSPLVAIHETSLLGEAFVEVWHRRLPIFERRLDDPESLAENLLDCEEPESALHVLKGKDFGLRGRYVKARALTELGRYDEATALLLGLDQETLVGMVELGLVQAVLYWRLGQKDEAEVLLLELSKSSDDARAHLFTLYMSRRDLQRAGKVLDQIENLWIKRELLQAFRQKGGKA